jgi:hypothetical protein
MMTTTPGFDRAFRPLRTTAPNGEVAQGRLHAAQLAFFSLLISTFWM